MEKKWQDIRWFLLLITMALLLVSMVYWYAIVTLLGSVVVAWICAWCGVAARNHSGNTTIDEDERKRFLSSLLSWTTFFIMFGTTVGILLAVPHNGISLRGSPYFW